MLFLLWQCTDLRFKRGLWHDRVNEIELETEPAGVGTESFTVKESVKALGFLPRYTMISSSDQANYLLKISQILPKKGGNHLDEAGEI